MKGMDAADATLELMRIMGPLIDMEAVKAHHRRELARKRKRSQRVRQEIKGATGQADLTADTITLAIFDALNRMLRTDDQDGHAEAVIALAASAFPTRPDAADVIKARIYGRAPRLLDRQ